MAANGAAAETAGMTGSEVIGVDGVGDAAGDDEVDEESKRFVKEGVVESDDFAKPLVISRMGEGVGFAATAAGAMVFFESTFAWSEKGPMRQRELVNTCQFSVLTQRGLVDCELDGPDSRPRAEVVLRMQSAS